MANKVVFISGPISGIKMGNFDAFLNAEERLTQAGYAVITPAYLPDDMPKDRYMPITLAMLQAADVVYMLQGWEDSRGATIEHKLAEYQGKEIRYE